MRIETTSSLNCASTCARKYKHRYVDRLQSPNYSSSLGLGTFVHAWAETLKPGGDQAAASKAVERELEKYKSVQQEATYQETALAIEADYTLARAIAPLWWEYWNKKDGYLSNQVLAFAETEKEWAFVIGGNALVGKRDGIVKHLQFEKTFLHEIKTSGDADRETYKLKLQMERQISNNIQAIRDEGRRCDGVLYDIIWKPAIRLKKEETAEEFLQRKIDCYKNEPNRYFERLFVYRSEADLKRAMINLQQQFGMLVAAEHFGYPRNESQCEQWGRLCEFFTDCMDGNDPQGFQKREEKFPEISPEFQQAIARAELGKCVLGPDATEEEVRSL